MKDQKTLLIGLGVFLITNMLIAMCLYILGYQTRVEWNNDLSQTTCKIIGHQVVEANYCYQNFKVSHRMTLETGYEMARKREVCHICWDDCYKGYIQSEYTIYEPTQRQLTFREYYVTKNTKSATESRLDRERPIGSSYSCYFHRSQPENVVKSKYYEDAFFKAALTFFSFAGIALIGILVSSFSLLLTKKN